MFYENGKARGLKVAYIGGGSRGWAWMLMNDLKKVDDMSGDVYLYDIDYTAAKNNEIIGNKIDGESWCYHASEAIGDALTGADFVVISILPGTFDEMEVDVHTAEKYGIWQSVGDTAGVGGFIRSLRTIPMMRKIAAAIRTYCPDAWVINYTNPMAVCVGALYREFPKIKAYGCCHEVFGTQKILSRALYEIENIGDVKREDIEVTVMGVNHFTWLTEARYKNVNLFDTYEKFVDKYYETGYTKISDEAHWLNSFFVSHERVKMDLFRRFGYIAAAGDRHLAEFMNPDEYLASPEVASSWHFGLTPVSWRRENLIERLKRSERLLSGEGKYKLCETGEEGTLQMRALLGLSSMITNVNLPNIGQIPNLPIGTIVETNAAFRTDSLKPIAAGNLPDSIYPLISRAARENDYMLEAGFSLDLGYAYTLFRKLNMLKNLSESERHELFTTLCLGNKKYLGDYSSFPENVK